MVLKKTPWAKKVVIAAVSGLLMLFFSVIIYLSGGFERLELLSYDLRFSLRSAEKPDPSIVLIGIDDYDRDVFKKNIKDFNRNIYAEVIRNLTDDGAYLIAIDMDFSMPTELSYDITFKEALDYSQRVVLGRSLKRSPYDLFEQAIVGEGVYDLQLDEDGILRSIYTNLQAVSDTGKLILRCPLGLELAQLYLFPHETPQVTITNGSIFFNDFRVPTKIYINFAGPPETYSLTHLSDVYFKHYAKGTYNNKIVIIGNTDPLAHDYFAVPLTRELSANQTDILRMSGLEIHANIFDTIISEKYIKRYSRNTVLLLLIVAGIIVTLLFSLLAGRAMYLFSLFLFIISGFSVLAYILFSHFLLWLDIVPLLTSISLIFITVAIAHWRMDRRERMVIRGLFGKYVSPQVAEMLVTNPELISFQGRKAILTIFFSDIRGFTRMSESLDPQQVSELLNEYFARMTQILFKYDGTLDKFMGDAIMAFFGNPKPYDDHALRAIKMSLEMMDEVRDLNKRWKHMGKNTFDIGIGINTGEVTVGNLGSENYFDYTVIGDNVNLACRLESIAKPGQIILSENTYRIVEKDVVAIALEPVLVKGKEKPVRIYEVQRLRHSCDEHPSSRERQSGNN